MAGQMFETVRKLFAKVITNSGTNHDYYGNHHWYFSCLLLLAAGDSRLDAVDRGFILSALCSDLAIPLRIAFCLPNTKQVRGWGKQNPKKQYTLTVVIPHELARIWRIVSLMLTIDGGTVTLPVHIESKRLIHHAADSSRYSKFIAAVAYSYLAPDRTVELDKVAELIRRSSLDTIRDFIADIQCKDLPNEITKAAPSVETLLQKFDSVCTPRARPPSKKTRNSADNTSASSSQSCFGLTIRGFDREKDPDAIAKQISEIMGDTGDYSSLEFTKDSHDH